MAETEPWHSDEYVRSCGARAAEVVLGSSVGRRSKQDVEKVIQFFRAYGCFYSSFCPEVLEGICQNLEYKTVVANTTIYKAGDHPTYVYLIASGRVEVTYTEQGGAHAAEDDEHNTEVEKTAPRFRHSMVQRRRVALQGSQSDQRPLPTREVESSVSKMRAVVNTMTVTRMAASLTAAAKSLTPKTGVPKKKVEEQPKRDPLKKDVLEDPGRLHESLLDVIKTLATREGSAKNTRTAFLQKSGVVEASGHRSKGTFADQFRSFGRRVDKKIKLQESAVHRERSEGDSAIDRIKFAVEKQEVEVPIESEKDESRKPSPQRSSISRWETPDGLRQELVTGQMFCLHACVSRLLECDNTATALEDTDLLVLHCSQFEAMVEKERAARRHRREQTLVNSVPCLRALDKEKLEKLAESFRSSVHRRGTVLVWEGETRMPHAEDDRLVLLVEGHARAVKAVGPEYDKQGLKSTLEREAVKHSHRVEAERAVVHRDVGVLLPGHVVNGASQLLEIPEPLTVIVDSAEVVVVSCAHADLARAAGSGILEGLRSASKDLSRWREQRLTALEAATPEEIKSRFFAAETAREDDELYLSTAHEKVEDWLQQDKAPPALPTSHGEVSATITHRREVNTLASGEQYVAHGREGTDLPSTPSPHDLSMSKPLVLGPGTRGATPACVAIHEAVNLGHVRRIFAIRTEDSQSQPKPKQHRRLPPTPAPPPTVLHARQRSTTPDDPEPPMPGNGTAAAFAVSLYSGKSLELNRLSRTAPARLGGTRSGPKGRSPSVSDAIFLPSPYAVRADSVGSRDSNNEDFPDDHFQTMPELSGFLAQLHEGSEAFKYPTEPRLHHLVALGASGKVIEVNPIDPLNVATVRRDFPRGLELRAATAPLPSKFMSSLDQPRVQTAPGPIRPPCLPRLPHRYRSLKQHSHSLGEEQVHQVGSQSFDILNGASWELSSLTDLLPDEQSNYWDDFETTLKPGSFGGLAEPPPSSAGTMAAFDACGLEQQVMVSKAPITEERQNSPKGRFTISVTEADSEELFQDSSLNTVQAGGPSLANVSTMADEQSIWDQMWSVIGGGIEESDGPPQNTQAPSREEVQECARGKSAQCLPLVDKFPTPSRPPLVRRAPGQPGTFNRSGLRPAKRGGRSAEKGHRAQEKKRLQSLGEDTPLHVHGIQRYLTNGSPRTMVSPMAVQELLEDERSENGPETVQQS